ncbi:MAG: hypothetical protein ACRDND_25660, partial [Streptosporangiaceae bacterium]
MPEDESQPSLAQPAQSPSGEPPAAEPPAGEPPAGEPHPGATSYRQTRFRPPPGATDILLIRHGESQAAYLEKPFPLVDGHADPDLAEN